MKLSIITINKNNAVGLRKTINSVLCQTYNNFEYIIIDGASTDDSLMLINEFSVGKFNFTWVSEPDTGIYNAMNKGIAIAKGEYLLFLNSGDFLIEQDVLERIFSYDNDADIIPTRVNVSDNGKVVWTSPFINKVSLNILYNVGLPHQTTFIRRYLFDIYGLYREDFRNNSDIAFWYKTIIFGNATTQGIDIITADYNLQGQSTRESETNAYLKEMREILSEGFLPKVLPDYDEWNLKNGILQKYIWIEQYPILQKLLVICRKILCKITVFIK